MTKTAEPPFYIAVRFARLKDRSVGQADEIEALFDALNCSERMLKMSNDALVRLVKRQKSLSPDYIQQTTLDIITDVVDALTRFYDARTSRIIRIIDYLKLAGREVNKETQQLNELELLWEDIKREYSRIKFEFMEKPLSKYTVNTIDDFKSFQDIISTKGIPIMKRLKELEQTMEGEIMNQISIFIKANNVVDSNELYSLLFNDP